MIAPRATRERLKYLSKAAEEIIWQLKLIDVSEDDLDPWVLDDGQLMEDLCKAIGKFNFGCEMLMFGGDLSIDTIAEEQIKVAVGIQADSSLKHQPLAMLSALAKGYNYIENEVEEDE